MSEHWEEDDNDSRILASFSMEREIAFLKVKSSEEDPLIFSDSGIYEANIDFDDASREWALRKTCVAISSTSGLRCKKKTSKHFDNLCSIHGVKHSKQK